MPAARAKARPRTEWSPLPAPGDENATATPAKPSARPKAASHVQRSCDPRKRPNRNTKMGWAPIISAMSALVVRVAAWPSSRKGTTCPISARATSLAHNPDRDPGQTLRESALVSSIAAAATPTRARANSRGSKAREAILISRRDEPQRSDRKASPAYAAMKFSRNGKAGTRGFGSLTSTKIPPRGHCLGDDHCLHRRTWRFGARIIQTWRLGEAIALPLSGLCRFCPVRLVGARESADRGARLRQKPKHRRQVVHAFG